MLRATVIITNYNYGRFLEAAIESALNQTYSACEVVVVDDGSTDESRELISVYGERVVPVLIEHGGQAAAFNAGFQASCGDVACFLDADDMLLPNAIEDAMEHFSDANVTKVHWMLSGVDETGLATGELIPELPLPAGDLRDELLAKGPGGYVWSPTSGNAWSRRFLERIFPMPEPEYVTCADTYLSLWAPLMGTIATVPKVNALYREHGSNNRYRISEQNITNFVEHARKVLDPYIREAGLTVDTAIWRDAFRWPDRDQALNELSTLLSPDQQFMLIDRGKFGEHFRLREHAIRIDLPEDRQALEGTSNAVAQFEHHRSRGASLLVVAWPAFPFLRSAQTLYEHVHERFSCVMETPRLAVYDVGRDLRNT
jgi:glycosyltransferase involved in cell wall biosynthesis